MPLGAGFLYQFGQIEQARLGEDHRHRSVQFGIAWVQLENPVNLQFPEFQLLMEFVPAGVRTS